VNEHVSDLGIELEDRPVEPRRQPPRRAFGCLAVVLSLAVLLGGGYLVYSFGVGAIKDRLRGAPDYAGTGSGQVLVEVKAGDASSDIGRTLQKADVVKSVAAFTEAARNDPKSVGIQVGFYEMRKQMSAEAALALLVDPANLMRSVVTVPEGLRKDQVVDLLVRKTKFSRKQYDAVLASPSRIGLPSYARGNAEGYLFPATYEVPPNATPRSVLSAMVQRYARAAADLDLAAKAKALGYSPHDVMTVASIVQAEGKLDRDFPKIAEVLYNRLHQGKPLELDTTIVYIFKTRGKLTTSAEQRQSDSPYNTYRRAGLPPTPIDAPGEAAIRAALNPTKGPWLYFVTTNPSNGAMSFASTYAEHLRNVAKFRAYCRTHDC
jgi:UPF0755 protein